MEGKRLESGKGGVTITDKGGGVYCMELANVKPNMTGQLVCKAENSAGVAESKAQIGVKRRRPSQKPEFQSPLHPINLTEGDTLKTKVLISGDPEPKVKWLINEKLVVETEDVEMIAEDGVYILAIQGVSFVNISFLF